MHFYYVPLIFILCLIAGFLLWKQSHLRSLLKKQHQRHQSLVQEKRILFDFLHDLGEAFEDDIDIRRILEMSLECCSKVTGAASGAVYLADPERKVLIAESVIGLFPPPYPVPEDIQSKLADKPDYLEMTLRKEALHADSSSYIASVYRDDVPLMFQLDKPNSAVPEFQEETLRLKSLIAVPLKYRNDELGVLVVANKTSGKPFTQADFDVVRSIGDQTSYSIHHAQIYSQISEKKQFDKDLSTAHEIQRILLPDQKPVCAGYDIEAINIPARHVSGDYYDFIRISPSRLGMVIADVSGKGIPASLIMAMCRTVLRTQMEGTISPAEVLRRANRILYPDISEEMFITMALVILDSEHSLATIAKAGHEPPLLSKNNFSQIESIQAPGMALGIDSGEVFDKVIQDVVIPLQPQDTLLVYTDGIHEAIDQDGQEFGREEIKTALKTASSLGVHALIDNLLDRVKRFRGNESQSDDITILAMQKL